MIGKQEPGGVTSSRLKKTRRKKEERPSLRLLKTLREMWGRNGEQGLWKELLPLGVKNKYSFSVYLDAFLGSWIRRDTSRVTASREGQTAQQILSGMGSCPRVPPNTRNCNRLEGVKRPGEKRKIVNEETRKGPRKKTNDESKNEGARAASLQRPYKVDGKKK